MNRLLKALVALSALAFLLALAGPLMAADTTKGTVKSVSADKKEFVMTDENGKDWTFKEGNKFDVIINAKATTLDHLKPGEKVYITYDKEGTRLVASEVTVRAMGEAAGLTANGKIKSVDTTNNEFVLTDKNGKEWTFHVNDATKVMASNSKAAKLSNLKAGDQVRVHYMKKGSDMWASDVREIQD
jgi:hypothetical protein